MIVRFYDKSRRHIRSVRGALSAGKLVAEIPAGAHFASSEIDGHRKLHGIPDWKGIKYD